MLKAECRWRRLTDFVGARDDAVNPERKIVRACREGNAGKGGVGY
jgi:hypothetical protein